MILFLFKNAMNLPLNKIEKNFERPFKKTFLSLECLLIFSIFSSIFLVFLLKESTILLLVQSSSSNSRLNSPIDSFTILWMSSDLELVDNFSLHFFHFLIKILLVVSLFFTFSEVFDFYSP